MRRATSIVPSATIDMADERDRMARRLAEVWVNSGAGRFSVVAAASRVAVIDASAWAAADWDALAVRSQLGDAFQSHAWGELKRGLAWTPLRYVFETDGRPVAVAYIQERALVRRLPGPLGRLRVQYSPHGPVLLDASPDAAAAALAGLRQIAGRRHAVTVTVDPVWEEGSALSGVLGAAGFHPATRDVQVSRTAMIVPLEASQEAQRALLGHTTGYDINRARKAGVTVEHVNMTDPADRESATAEFFEMHAATGRREGFIVRDRHYAMEQWRRLGESDVAGLWFAGVEGRRETGALVLRCGHLLTYFAAGSRDDADMRRTRANHLLQWEIIRWAAASGFSGYDMGGVDTHDAPGVPQDETHPLWNLFLFKRRFGAVPQVRVRAHEYSPNPVMGAAWRLLRRLR